MAFLLLPFVCVVLFATSVLSDSSSSCAAFSINGSTANHFAYYRFYDFRNIHSTAGPPNPSSDLPMSKSVNDTLWLDDWKVRVQSKRAPNDYTLPMQYSASNVYIENSTDFSPEYSTYLTLSTTCLSNSSQQTGEIDYAEQNVTHASIRVRARVSGAPGAVAGFFTYHDDDTESDIEILTRDPDGYVHYSNQPTADSSGKAIPGSTYNVSIPAGRKWTDWNTYRIDWVAGQSAWYVNGVRRATTKVNVPGAPSVVILNMWSNGGAWAGSMKEGDEAFLQVQWVEMVFNTSTQPASSSGSGKPVICSIDKVLGMPTVSSLGARTDGRNGWTLLLSPLLFMVWMAFV